MCIVRQKDLSADDLAFLSGRSPVFEPDEEAMQRSLAIHEPRGVDFGPPCMSQLVQYVAACRFGGSAR